MKRQVQPPSITRQTPDGWDLEAEITLSYEDESEAATVANAISPENVTCPPSLTVTTVRRESRVITVVRCKQQLETLTAAIDNLLMAVQAAEKTLLSR